MIRLPFGKSSGMIISLEDAKFRPLSQCRSTTCWVGGDGTITVISFNVEGEKIVIPYNKERGILEQEKDGELGVDLLKRLKIIN